MTTAQTKATRHKMMHDPRWKHKGKRSADASARKIARQLEKEKRRNAAVQTAKSVRAATKK